MHAVILILSDSRGIYIPRDFLTDQYNDIDYNHCAVWGLTQENVSHWIEAVNPESESYWEAWDWVIQNAKFTNTDGSVYTLHQDGDLWGVCYDRMTDEEKHNFGFDI